MTIPIHYPTTRDELMSILSDRPLHFRVCFLHFPGGIVEGIDLLGDSGYYIYDPEDGRSVRPDFDTLSLPWCMAYDNQGYIFDFKLH